MAGGNLALLAEQDSDYSLYDMKKKGGWGSKETQRDEVTDVKNVGSVIKTGGDLTLSSGGDQLYQAAKLESGNDIAITSGGAVTFEAVKDLLQESHEKSKSDLAWVSAKGKGKTDETLRQTQMLADGNLAIKAVDGLKIDIKQIDQHTVSQAIDVMVKADPQLAWLKDAEKRGDVDWRQVQEMHDSFKYSHSNLGQGAMLAIIIIVTVLTAGAGSALAGGAAGATAGSGTAMAAGGVATAGASAGTFVAAGWGNVMATSALTSLASGGAVSFINNGGNLGATLQDVTSSDSLKNYATGALTAGFTAGVLDPAFGVSGDNVNKVTKGFDLGSATDIGRFAAYSGAQGVAQAGVGTALQGGSLNKNLGSALSSQLQRTLQAVAFNAVGDYSKDQQWADSGAQKVALHALVGGLLSQAGGGSFATGALAAGANEALVSTLSKAVEGEPGLLLAASQLIGIAAAGATGGDVQKGAEIAKNATAYNYLNHHEADDLIKDLKGCRGAGDPTACRADVTAHYQRLSDTKTGLAMLQCEGYTNCNALRTDVEAGTKALDDHGYSAGLSPQEQQIVRGFQDKNQDDLRLTVQKTTQATNGEVAGIVLSGGLGAGARVVGEVGVVKGGAASVGPKGAGTSLERGLAYDNPSNLIQSRVSEIQSQIPANSQGRITMGVAVVEDANGVRSVLVSTSEPRGYLRPGVSLQEGEKVVVGTGHAEADIVSYANANGLKVVDIGATRPVCASCQNVIEPTGANVSTPLKPLPKAKQ